MEVMTTVEDMHQVHILYCFEQRSLKGCLQAEDGGEAHVSVSWKQPVERLRASNLYPSYMFLCLAETLGN